MARVRWEYREVIRTVVVETDGPDPVNRSRINVPARASAPPTVPFGRVELARLAAPAVAAAALALARGFAERRLRSAMRSDAVLGAGPAPVIALPAGDRSSRAASDPD